MDINCNKVDWSGAGGSDHSYRLTFWPTSLFSFEVSLLHGCVIINHKCKPKSCSLNRKFEFFYFFLLHCNFWNVFWSRVAQCKLLSFIQVASRFTQVVGPAYGREHPCARKKALRSGSDRLTVFEVVNITAFVLRSMKNLPLRKHRPQPLKELSNYESW